MFQNYTISNSKFSVSRRDTYYHSYKNLPALKGKIERLNIHANINEDIIDIKSELETMNEAAKGLDIQVEVDRGMMTTARNKFTDAIFMKILDWTLTVFP